MSSLIPAVATNIARKIYLDRMRPLLGTPQIKVLTGMRRSGKSVLLAQLAHELIHAPSSVQPSHICWIDMEDLAFDHLRTYKDLHAYIEGYFKKIATSSHKKYLFIDEIQEISEWERVVRHYAKQTDFEVFITGSNSNFLSSELATMLAGRYVSFHVYPLCYREFLEFRPSGDFNEFVLLGGLPGVVMLEGEQTKREALEGILHTVLFRDVIERFEVRNGALLTDVLKFIASNIGNPTTTQSIVAHLKSERISLAFETIRDYLQHYARAFLVYPVGWQDAIGKRHLNLNQKYYFSDLGLRHRLLPMRAEHRGQVLENIVYQELLVRGYSVTIGRVGMLEVDFVAERGSEKIYIQVCYLLASEETITREFRSLKAIPDNHPKLVLSMDTAWGGGDDGIVWLNLVEWLATDTPY